MFRRKNRTKISGLHEKLRDNFNDLTILFLLFCRRKEKIEDLVTSLLHCAVMRGCASTSKFTNFFLLHCAVYTLMTGLRAKSLSVFDFAVEKTEKQKPEKAKLVFVRNCSETLCL